MKETIKINLNGQLFDLDNDAYNRLKAYLSAIETRFSASADEAKEILEDIEARIAEILPRKDYSQQTGNQPSGYRRNHSGNGHSRRH